MHYVRLLYFGMSLILFVGLPVNFSIARCYAKKFDHTYSCRQWNTLKYIQGKY